MRAGVLVLILFLGGELRLWEVNQLALIHNECRFMQMHMQTRQDGMHRVLLTSQPQHKWAG